jgi:purine-cytosine permease-like protein
MVMVAVALTIACARVSASPPAAPQTAMSWWRGLDVVIGYQVSWILMFADYSRYTRSVRGSALAVFFGLAVTSAWMMPLGAVAARAAGTSDPGAMLDAVGLALRRLPSTLATLIQLREHLHVVLAWKPGATGE